MNDRIFFKAGDVVCIKQDIEKPKMVVKKVQKTFLRKEESEDTKDTKPKVLMGVVCFWFNEMLGYEERMFSTKDLVHIKD